MCLFAYLSFITLFTLDLSVPLRIVDNRNETQIVDSKIFAII